MCPFLDQAIRHENLLLSQNLDLRSPDLSEVIDELNHCIIDFQQLRWTGANPSLQSLVITFPHLGEAEAPLLHQAHNTIKEDIIQQDLIMAVFHPYCADRAARGPDLPAFQSPVPMIAIRRMAFHDILFLDHDRSRFLRYTAKFGKHYRNPERLDPLFVAHYRAGVARHGET